MKNKVFKILSLLSVLVLLYSCNRSNAEHGAPHTFDWVPADNRALGFNLYCGTSSGAYTSNINIPDGTTTSYPVLSANLPNGQNYCALSAYNFVGESPLTSEIVFSIQDGDLTITVPGTPINFSIN